MAEEHVGAIHRFRHALGRVNRAAERYMGLFVWLFGVVLVLNTVFQVQPKMYEQFAEYPRAAAFMFGVMFYVVGGELRKARGEDGD